MIHRNNFYECVKSRLMSMPCKNQKSANRILRGTNAYIWFHKGKFGWSAYKASCYGFKTPREALYDILMYFMGGGY